MRSANDENKSEVKCNDKAQHGLLMEYQYNADPLFTDTALYISSKPKHSCL
jgi:hypothetical protein